MHRYHVSLQHRNDNYQVEPLYLTIGRHAITAVVMVNKDEYLWASCEDEICVISPKTLEIKHRFTVGPDKQVYIRDTRLV